MFHNIFATFQHEMLSIIILSSSTFCKHTFPAGKQKSGLHNIQLFTYIVYWELPSSKTFIWYIFIFIYNIYFYKNDDFFRQKFFGFGVLDIYKCPFWQNRIKNLKKTVKKWLWPLCSHLHFEKFQVVMTNFFEKNKIFGQKYLM